MPQMHSSLRAAMHLVHMLRALMTTKKKNKDNSYSHRRENLQFHTVKICETVTAGNVAVDCKHLTTLKIQAEIPTKVVSVYQSRRCYVPEDGNIHINV